MNIRVNNMIYSLQQLFQLIDQPKSPHEFYSEYSGDFGIDYYINRITRFTPEENRIICGFGDEIPLYGLNIEKKTIAIEDSDMLLFLYISHNEDFFIERQKSIDDVLEFLYSTNGIQNEFWGDIGIIYKNHRIKCYVRTKTGHYMTKDDFDTIEYKDFKSVYQIELQ